MAVSLIMIIVGLPLVGLNEEYILSSSFVYVI